jgi:hypothetical protein
MLITPILNEGAPLKTVSTSDGLVSSLNYDSPISTPPYYTTYPDTRVNGGGTAC